MANIWIKKPMEAYEADIKKSQLKRVLGKWSLTAIGIGAIIGGGIFVLTGTGAYYNAGPALALLSLSRGSLVFLQHYVMQSLRPFFLWKVLLTLMPMEPLEKFSHGLLVGD